MFGVLLWATAAPFFVVSIVAWLTCALSLEVSQAHAQTPAPGPDPGAVDGDEVIVFDDEPQTAPVPAESASPAWIARAKLQGEVGLLTLLDTGFEGDRENVVETRFRAALRSEYEYSERLQFVLASRLDYFWAMPGFVEVEDRGSRFDQSRFELDAELMAAYVAFQDGKILHAQVGQQVIATGRLDVFTSLDPLGVYDARAGPSLQPDSMRLPQPALRIDLDRGGKVTFQAIFVPWFRTHRLRLGRDRYDTRVLLGNKATVALDSTSSGYDPSQEPIARELALELKAPPPSFGSPQGFARLGFRAPRTDFGFSAATALEKQPFIYATPALEAYLLDPEDKAKVSALSAAVASNQQLADVRYPRYALFGFDIGGGFGSSMLAFELAYSPARQLYTAPLVKGGIPRPDRDGPIRDARSRPTGVQTAQIGAHFDHAWGDEVVLVVESTYFRALTLPHDSERYWMGLDVNRADFASLLVGGKWLPAGSPWTVGSSVVAASEATLFIQPQIEYRPLDGLILAAGGIWAFGRAPQIQPAGGTANLALGGLSQRDNNVYGSVRCLW